VDGYQPIQGKCFYWREQVDESDRFNTRVKPEDWHVECSCFVEGDPLVLHGEHHAGRLPGEAPLPLLHLLQLTGERPPKGPFRKSALVV